MSTQTQTLADFLLARIAADEAEVAETREFWRSHRGMAGKRKAQIERAERECEAKRRIVEMQAANDEDRYLPGFHYKAQMIERTLRALALPYADHPDFREEWRP